MADPKLYQQIKSVFDKYNVPEHVWYPIALAESNFNPNAIGDSGASIGLFQVNNVGGQGVGLSRDQLLDPNTNAEIAARAISNAYNAIRNTTDLRMQAGETARRSGHPGGSVTSPFDASDARIKRINDLSAKFIAGGMQVTRQGADGTDGGVIVASDIADAVMTPLDKFITDLRSWFGKIDLGAIGITGAGVVLILIALIAFAYDKRDDIAKTVGTVAKVAVA